MNRCASGGLKMGCRLRLCSVWHEALRICIVLRARYGRCPNQGLSAAMCTGGSHLGDKRRNVSKLTDWLAGGDRRLHQCSSSINDNFQWILTHKARSAHCISCVSQDSKASPHYPTLWLSALPRWPPAWYPATGRAISSKGRAMARLSAPWWSGRHAWSSWPKWTELMPLVACNRQSGSNPTPHIRILPLHGARPCVVLPNIAHELALEILL